MRHIHVMIQQHFGFVKYEPVCACARHFACSNFEFNDEDPIPWSDVLALGHSFQQSSLRHGVVARAVLLYCAEHTSALVLN
jgi:hypothetical protein